jgi:uncharacterized membrane-anchored protein
LTDYNLRLKEAFSGLAYMEILVLLLQISELFKGNINREGIISLLLFVLMGAIVVGFSVFLIYKAFGKKNQ